MKRHFYEHSGEHGYLHCNASYQELLRVLVALGHWEQMDDFGWESWGRNVLPAANGATYDFYIHLRTQAGAKPGKAAVDAFVMGYRLARRKNGSEADELATMPRMLLPHKNNMQGKLMLNLFLRFLQKKMAPAYEQSIANKAIDLNWLMEMQMQTDADLMPLMVGVAELADAYTTLNEALAQISDEKAA